MNKLDRNAVKSMVFYLVVFFIWVYNTYNITFTSGSFIRGLIKNSSYCCINY